MSFILNHILKTLSLLLHISIAYRLSSSGSTYSSEIKSRVLPDDDKRYAIETCRSSESVLKKCFKINEIQLVHLLVV